MLKSSIILLSSLFIFSVANAETEAECQATQTKVNSIFSSANIPMTGSDSVLSIICQKMGEGFIGKIEKNKLDTLNVAQLKSLGQSMKNCGNQTMANKGGRGVASAADCGKAQAFVSQVLAKASDDIEQALAVDSQGVKSNRCDCSREGGVNEKSTDKNIVKAKYKPGKFTEPLPKVLPLGIRSGSVCYDSQGNFHSLGCDPMICAKAAGGTCR